MTGQISTLLGGLNSAAIGLSMQYSDLNQTQAITAPTSVAPYSQFQTKLRTFEQGIQNTLTGQATGSSATPSASGTTGPSATTGPSGTTGASGTTSKYQAYGQCIQAAAGDVGKMQQCAPLLNGSG